MPRIGCTACVLAFVCPPLVCPSLALAGGPAASRANTANGAANEAKAHGGTPTKTATGTPRAPEPTPTESLAAARTDLDSVLKALLSQRPASAEDPDPAELKREVPPRVFSSEVPPPLLAPEPQSGFDWLQGIELPDLPIRWHDQLLDLLTYYRDDPRGRAHIRLWLKRSGRYEPMIQKKLAEAGLPRDLIYVAMVESGFDPVIESHAAAVGLWQMVASTAGEYGLEQTRWLDDRRNPERATDAAIHYLKDLHDKLGSWPLSLAAFNMGFGGLLRSVRKYNTNDYWLLARLEAGLPYETVLYVAKVMACAIIAHNPERFGLADVAKDPAPEFVTVQVPGGIPLSRLSNATLVPTSELADLNPELLRQRVPPDTEHWDLRIPARSRAQFVRRFPQIQAAEPAYASHILRFGERLEDVAAQYDTTPRKLRTLNDLGDDELVQAGVRLRVPNVTPHAIEEGDTTVVAVPHLAFSYPTRKRIFYRIKAGDRADQIARFFKVDMRELRLWNAITPDANLHPGMILQLYVPKDVDLTRVVYLSPEKARELVVGSPEFLDYHEGLRDRIRVRYRVKTGDTLSNLADRFDLSVGSICRINGFDRNKTLAPDSEIILYTKATEPAPSKQPSRPSAHR